MLLRLATGHSALIDVAREASAIVLQIHDAASARFNYGLVNLQREK
jgi:hypothetical protein